jgi:alpha-tubulin suppressor-like RCC1 family protein
MATGAVWCWGQNHHGQLGDGTLGSESAAVAVKGITDAVDVSAGSEHTCAVTASGGAKCWGNNDSGQLGDGTFTDSKVPVDVAGLTSGVVAVAAGFSHTCALMSAGGVKCWGDNLFRQLSLAPGVVNQSLVPVDMSGLTSGVAAVFAGYEHTCAAITDGSVECWGRDAEGQLGGPETYGQPVDVPGLTNVTGLAMGEFFTCADMADGTTKCWGQVPLQGSLPVPTDEVGISGANAIAAGESFVCVAGSGGAMRCLGRNVEGELGDGTNTNSGSPVDVAGITGATQIGAGYHHTCAVVDGGAVRCWGYNDKGQLGNTTLNDSNIPVQVQTYA